MKTNNTIFTDRYEALGIDYPHPDTICDGHCEGTGMIPVKISEEQDPVLLKLAQDMHNKNCNVISQFRSMFNHPEWWYWKSIVRDWFKGQICDGWHFVTCPDCNGTGKKKVDNV